MARGKRLAALALFFGASIVTVALAQKPKPTGKPTPKPKPSAVVDAGDTAPTTDIDAAAPAPSASTVQADDGGPVAPPSTLLVGDGGIRPSPLNPAPNEFGTAGLDAGTVDYDKLIADIAALRARVAAVADTLFHSRIAISLQVQGDHARIGRLVVSLDDGAVFTAPGSFKAEDLTPILSQALAPGRHALTVDIDRKDDRNDAFKTGQRSRFSVEVPKDQELAVELRVEDDSSMAKFPNDNEGKYDLRVRMKAFARPVGGKK